MASFRPDDFRSTISVIAIFKLIRDKYTLQVVEKAFKVVQMLFSTSFGNRLIPMTYDQVKGGFTKNVNCEQQSHNGQYDSNRYQHVIFLISDSSRFSLFVYRIYLKQFLNICFSVEIGELGDFIVELYE